MNKAEFLAALRINLCGMPEQDVQKAEDFYSEMIDDRIDSGMSETEAAASLGSPEDAARGILLEMPLGKLIKVKARRSRRLSALEIILLVLGFPVWGALVVSAIAVFVSIYVSLWAIVVSLYAADFAIAVSALSAFVAAGVMFTGGNGAAGVFLLGAAIACVGLSVLMFFVCNFVAKGLVFVSKLGVKGLKKLFVKGGDKE